MKRTKLFAIPAMALMLLASSCTKEIEKKEGETLDDLNTYGAETIFDIDVSDETVEASLKTSDYTILYKGDQSNSSMFISGIEVYDPVSSELLLETNFEEDLTQEFYKLYTRNDLKEIADDLLSTTSLEASELTELAEDLQSMHQEIKIYSGDLFFQKLMYNGINFHLSIIEMVKRAKIAALEECGCTTTALYFDEEAAFACTEDVIFKREVILSFLNSSEEFDPELVENVEALPNVTFSLEELEQQYSSLPSTGDVDHDPTSGARLFCFGMSGSDPGCCGNYSGPCWFCHGACLWHDLQCWCCDSQIVNCFSGCVSEEGC